MKLSAKNCEVEIFPDAETLSESAAELIVEIAAETLQTKNNFSIALSGGSTPKSLYQLLASDKLKNKIDWTQTLVFFSDERCVAPDDEQSNYRMANEALLSRVPLPPENVFRMRGEAEPEKAAVEYEEIIKKKLGANPRFDLILLGMGDDGHTASLFPETRAVRENKRLVAANLVEKLNSFRLTLTFPAINAARNILFLVAGAGKSEILNKVLHAESIDLPASLVKPEDGNCLWLLDKTASQSLI